MLSTPYKIITAREFQTRKCLHCVHRMQQNSYRLPNCYRSNFQRQVKCTIHFTMYTSNFSYRMTFPVHSKCIRCILSANTNKAISHISQNCIIFSSIILRPFSSSQKTHQRFSKSLHTLDEQPTCV